MQIIPIHTPRLNPNENLIDHLVEALSTSGLTLFGTSPLSLSSSTNGAGNILDLGGNNLLFTSQNHLKKKKKSN
jgi:hypothetical protein